MKPVHLLLLGWLGTAVAQTAVPSQPIDLPTVLKLAGAESVEVRLAEEKLREAQALEDGTLWLMFPTLSPGVGYRAHAGRTQTVTGPVLDVDKQSLGAGATLQLQLEIGESLYRRLAAQQVAVAAGHGLTAQRLRSVHEATDAYFDLLRAELGLKLREQAVQLARDYHGQVSRGVLAGIAAKGDEYRAFAQLNRTEVSLRQAEENRSKEATRLAQLLRLHIDGRLRPATAQAALLTFTEKDAPLDQLVQKALARRPEIAENEALTEAAGREVDGARYAPLYPTLGVQAFAGGLGGSTGSARRDYASSNDTSVTLSWKIGAGGLFDGSRQETAEARERQTRLRGTRTREAVTRQVVDAQAEVCTLLAQLELLRQGVTASEAGLELALRRKEFAVGVVLEAVQAQQDAVQAKLDYLSTLTAANKAQYRLRAALGD